jgi:hypothetical protein
MTIEAHLLKMLMISFPSPICLVVASSPASSALIFSSSTLQDVECIVSIISDCDYILDLKSKLNRQIS